MNRTHARRRPLAVALFAAMAAIQAAPAMAQDAAESSSRATDLDKITVTGSLIPQTELETFKPVTVISAEDIKVRGFTSVSDAIQQASMATGGVQGAQTSASFTIFGASHFGIPLSTTHTITTGIVGASASLRTYDVRWGVLRRIVAAWCLTFPLCALLAFAAALLANWLFS